MKIKLLAMALLSGLVMTASAVQAQDKRERPDFATLDADGDGAVTQAELQAHAAARFAAIDADGSGAVTAEELAEAASGKAAARATRMIERLDANDDGQLQQDELLARGGDRAGRMFERVDTDDDGAISQEEFDAAQERRGGRDGGKRHGGDRGSRDRG